MTHFTELPPDLPVPVDDGACAHLPGLAMPSLRLPSTAGRLVDLGALRRRTDGDLLLSADRPAGRAAAGRLGRDPRRSGLHSRSPAPFAITTASSPI